jgi:hypothetical protein
MVPSLSRGTGKNEQDFTPVVDYKIGFFVGLRGLTWCLRTADVSVDMLLS